MRSKRRGSSRNRRKVACRARTSPPKRWPTGDGSRTATRWSTPCGRRKGRPPRCAMPTTSARAGLAAGARSRGDRSGDRRRRQLLPRRLPRLADAMVQGGRCVPGARPQGAGEQSPADRGQMLLSAAVATISPATCTTTSAACCLRPGDRCFARSRSTGRRRRILAARAGGDCLTTPRCGRFCGCRAWSGRPACFHRRRQLEHDHARRVQYYLDRGMAALASMGRGRASPRAHRPGAARRWITIGR